MADAVEAADLQAGLAARHHAGLHVAAGEILQLVVDVQVSDAAVETGHVDGLGGGAHRRGQHLLWHTWEEAAATVVKNWKFLYLGFYKDWIKTGSNVEARINTNKRRRQQQNFVNELNLPSLKSMILLMSF